MSESEATRKERKKATENGGILWRNNRGVAVDNRGNYVRYGLANESKQMGDNLKSSDLIGITPIIVTPKHVGQRLGIFTAIEMKKPGWKFQGNTHEIGQLRYLELVTSFGGIGYFSTGE